MARDGLGDKGSPKARGGRQANALGYLFADVGVIVCTQPATVRGPDLAFVRANRLPSGPPARGFLDFVPDLCIEVVSASNTATEIREKTGEYPPGA